MSIDHVVGLGEAMIRLTTPTGVPLPAAGTFAATVGGAELNALVAARLAGAPATWVTALPDSGLADLVRRQAAAADVDIVEAASDGTRVGLYFLEAHAPPRPAEVTYDRAHSAFAQLDPASLDWSALLGPRSCLLLSGITPALGQGPVRALHDALDTARAAGSTVALDVNFRPSLWSAQECFDALRRLLPAVDVLSASPIDLAALGVEDAEPFKTAITQLGLQAVVGTRKVYRGPTVEVELVAADAEGVIHRTVTATVVDAVGTGDALFGTFLATLLSGAGLERAADRALGAAVSAYGTAGDLLCGPPWEPDGQSGGVRR
jgi:2-dehydro-3-deoxygluconokinase